MHVPKGCQLRPEYTGWMGDLSSLSLVQTDTVNYSDSGLRFAGATMDFSALYRLVSVLELFKNDQLTVEVIHRHVQKNQQYFLTLIDDLKHPLLNRGHLMVHDIDHHGHFLTFKFDRQAVSELAAKLDAAGIHTDHRGDRLRFGFALYHSFDYDLSVLVSA